MNRTCAPVLSGFSGPYSRVKKTKLSNVTISRRFNLKMALYEKYKRTEIFGMYGISPILPILNKPLSFFTDHGDHGYFDESKFSLMYYADEMCNATIRTRVRKSYRYLDLHFFHTRRG